MPAKRIERYERLNNSASGNPRYELHFADGDSAITSSDSDSAYEIGNPGLRAGDIVVLAFTRSGRIACIESREQFYTRLRREGVEETAARHYTADAFSVSQ